jgi:hypothetical protein
MKRLVLLATAFFLVGCGDTPTSAPADTDGAPPLFSHVAPNASHSGGAIVLNSGEGKPDGSCFFGPFTADRVTAVRAASGTAQLSCSFSGLPPVEKTEQIKDFNCFLNLGGISFTTESLFVWNKSGKGQMTCQFNVNENGALTFTEVDKFPINFLAYVPCALDGAGELVELQGDLHSVFHVTEDGSGGFHIGGLSSYQGVSGVGQTSGDSYQANGGSHFRFNAGDPLPFTDTFVDNFRIIGQGPGNNFLVHYNYHVTVNANGELTASVDNFKAECK